MSIRRKLLAVLAALAALIVPLAASGAPPAAGPGDPEVLATLPGGAASGSAIGPGGALYVPQPAEGEIWRVDLKSGDDPTVYASGLPERLLWFGGVMDVAFIGSTAYALVSVVGSDFGGSDTVGIYRVDGPDSFTVIADIGTFSASNPPETSFALSTGVQYALEAYRGGFLVTDGHHNRVLHVTLDGEIAEFMTFGSDPDGNVVPTGLAVSGNTIYMAEAGPVPHVAQDGKIVSFEPGASSATDVASGAQLAVDVEIGRGQTLFALSQGELQDGGTPADPAVPDTGALFRANAGGMTMVASGLDQPTSLEIIGNTAYVVTLGGEIWKIDGIAGPPYGG